MEINRTTRLEDLPEYLRPEEVQAWLGLSRSGTYKLIREGHLPCRRIGRVILIPRAFFTQDN